MQPELHDGGEPQKDSPSIVPIVKGRRWDAARDTFKLMDERAHPESVVPDNAGQGIQRVWTGYIGKLMEELGYDRSMGTRVFRDLQTWGCIELKTYGKKGKLSQALVIQPPTEEAYAGTRDTLHLTSKSQEKAQARHAEQNSLLERIQWLEETVTILAEEVNRHQSEDHAQKPQRT